MWNGSANSIVEGNTFIDCQREIALGLIQRTSPRDHSGGFVRNNFIYRSSAIAGDVAVGVFDSPNTQVLHNTALLSGSYPNAVEYRFVQTTGAVVVNNLFDSAVQSRDGAAGTVSGNSNLASAALFIDAASGDLHLKSTASIAIDKVTVMANAPTDWDGQARPSGPGADIGADEFSALLSAPTNLRIGHQD
jgi:hypothetical protein